MPASFSKFSISQVFKHSSTTTAAVANGGRGKKFAQSEFSLRWRLDCRIQSPGRGDNGGGGLRGRFFLFAQNRFFAKQVDWKEKDFLTEESPQISSFSDSYASIAPLLQTCHPFFDFCQNFCQKSALRAMEMFHCRVLVEFSLHSRRKSFLLRIRNQGLSGEKKGVH